jgi:TP901 family phage tail tape measure protein
MASNAELQFIIKMRDEASAVLKQLQGSMGSTGSSAQAASTDLGGVTAALGKTVAATMELVTANEMLKGSLDAFGQYEQRMSIVEKVTGQTKEQMKEFEAAFDSMVSKIQGGAKVDALANYAGQAAQLGIRGSADLNKFTEVMAKLSNTTTTVGEQGAKELARVLFATQQGADGAEHFASVLTALGKQSAATEGHILHTTATLAQATSQFHLSGEALLGLSSAAASLNFQPQLFSTAVSRTLIALKDAAIEGSAGMKELSAATGISAAEFKDMIDKDPSRALLTFVNALHALDSQGRSTTAFLTSFKLQAQENVRVLGTMAANLDLFKKQIAAAEHEQGATSLNQENEVALRTWVKIVQDLDNQWFLFKKNFGEALSPVAEAALKKVSGLIEDINTRFKALPENMQEVVAWTAVVIPALAGVLTAAGLLAGSLTGIGALAGAAGLGAVETAAGAAAIAVTGLAGAFAAFVAGGAIYLGLSALANKVRDLFPNMTHDIDAYVDQNFPDANKVPVNKPASEAEKKEARDNAFGNEPNLFPRQGVFPVPDVDASKISTWNDKDTAAIERLDKWTKQIDMLNKAQDALNKNKGLNPNDPNKRSDEDITRMQALLDLDKARVDPAKARLKALDDEMQKLQAYTAQEKMVAQIEEDIRKVREQRGTVSTDDAEAIASRVRAAEQARTSVAMQGQTDQFQSQMRVAQSITQEERNRADIENKLKDFAREHAELSQKDLDILKQQTEELQRQQQWNDLRTRTDPIGTAGIKFLDDVKALNAELQRGQISLDEFNRRVALLKTQTLDQRDPMGAQIKSLNEQIGQMRIIGDYMDADRKTQETINQLKDRGVQVTKDEAAALQTVNRNLQDAQKAQSSGFTGWANSVGSVSDNMRDLEKDFASGLSSAVSGAFQGKGAASAQQFLQNMSTKILDMFSNQLIKGMLGNMGMLDGGKKQLDAASDAAKKLAGLNQTVATMQVQAANVTIMGGTMSNMNLGAGNDNGFSGGAAYGFGTKPSTVGGNDGFSGGAAYGFNGSIPALGNIGNWTNSGKLTGGAFIAPNDMYALMRAQGLPQNEAANFAAVLSKEGAVGGKLYSGSFGYQKGENGGVLNPEGAYGFAQLNGPRQNDLKKFAEAQGGLPADPATQAAFYVQDARNKNIDLGSVDDIVKRYEIPAKRFQQGEIDAAKTQASKFSDSNLPDAGAGAGSADSKNNWDGMLQDEKQYQEQLKGLEQQYGSEKLSAVQETSQQQVQAVQQAGQEQTQAVQQGTQEQTATVQNASLEGSQSFQTLQSSLDSASSSAERAGSSFETAGQQVQSAGNNAGSAGGDMGGLGSGIGQVGGAATRAIPGLGGFSGAISQLLSSLTKGIGGGGGGLFGGGGGLFGGGGSQLIDGVSWIHGGAEVGATHPFKMGSIHASAFAGAKRYHTGLKNDEFPAILQQGERVLTADQNKKATSLLKGAANANRIGGEEAAGGTNVVTFAPKTEINIQMSGSSGDQQKDQSHAEDTARQIQTAMDQAMTKWTQEQMRPGGMLRAARNLN